MEEKVCVQCHNTKPVNSTDNRLVTEACGHVKCMDCLINEKQGCNACVSSTKCANIESANKEHESTNGKKKSTGFPNHAFPDHIKVGTDDKGRCCYLCTICTKTLHTRRQIRYHAYCDSKHKLPYCCTPCDKEFVTRSHFKYHMSVHRGERSHSCDVCGDSFYQKSKLQRHKLKHTGEKNFVCEVCLKAFNNCTALRKHRLTHTGDRPYPCPDLACPRRFRDSSNLRKHVASHAGNKYRCVVCGRELGSARQLVDHRRSQHERHVFQCPRCPRTFYTRKDMRRHSTVHSDLLPFCCKVCVRKFSRKDNLDRHIRNTHPDHLAADAVEVDHKALTDLLKDSNHHKDVACKTYDDYGKSNLEILNPLPPLDLDVIKKHLTDVKKTSHDNVASKNCDDYERGQLQTQNPSPPSNHDVVKKQLADVKKPLADVKKPPADVKKTSHDDVSSKTYDDYEKSKLQILNPLPPLDRDVIKKHLTDVKNTSHDDVTNAPIDPDSYIRSILEANNARQSVILSLSDVKKETQDMSPKNQEFEYVHKIRKARNMDVYKKILYDPSEANCEKNSHEDCHDAKNAKNGPEMHWRRKMKMNNINW